MDLTFHVNNFFFLGSFCVESVQGAIHCPYYMKTGTCKYGATCRFDHPPPGEVMAMATTQGTSSPTGGQVKEDRNEPESQ